MSNTNVTVRLHVADYTDHDDCLAAAAEEYASEHGLEGWDLEPRWADGQRDEILLTVPAHSLAVEVDLDTPSGPVVEYGDQEASEVEAELPEGWRVDWETPAVRTASGRWRAPLVRLVGRPRTSRGAAGARLSVRLTPDERAQIDTAASASGLTAAEYVRRAALQ